MKNITMHHANAMTIHRISSRWMGCFHQTRWSGGWMALIVCSLSRRASRSLRERADRNAQDAHDAPDDVEHGGHRHAEKEQQERVLEDHLHRRDLLFIGRHRALLVAHLSISPVSRVTGLAPAHVFKGTARPASQA